MQLGQQDPHQPTRKSNRKLSIHKTDEIKCSSAYETLCIDENDDKSCNSYDIISTLSESSTSSDKTSDEISSGNTEQKKNRNISTKRKEIKGMDKNTVIKEKKGNSNCDNQTIKVVLRVEKTEVFKTG